MKITIEGYIGPNTVVGGKVRARIAVNAPHPAVGETVEVKDAETRKATDEELAKVAALKAGVKAEAKAEETADRAAAAADKAAAKK